MTSQVNMVAGASRGFPDVVPLVKGQEQQWQLLMIATLQSIDAWDIAQGHEVSPDEPDADAPEEVRQLYEKDLEDYFRRSRLGKSIIARSLALGASTQGKAARVLRMDTLAEIWRFVKTSFIAKTEKSVEKARLAYEQCKQKTNDKNRIFLRTTCDNA